MPVGANEADADHGTLQPMQRPSLMNWKMRIETKFLRLKTPVALGSLFGDWRVCWLGGWDKHRIYYLVMLSRVMPGPQM